MANFAPPISRDGFVYHGQLFADVGNLNRHPRASIQDLTELLRPNKPAKDDQSKDQVGHWYFAQLKHYGLPTTKDKNAAKVRLLNAINGGQIEVPKDVKKLEAQLRKEYDAANKKAKAELKVGGTSPVPPATTAKPTTNKRKRGDEDTVPKKAPAKKKAASASTPMHARSGPSISIGSNGGININIAYQEFLGNVSDAQAQAKKAMPKKTTTVAKSTTSAKTTTPKLPAAKGASSATTTQKKTTKAASTKTATATKTTTKAAATKSEASKSKSTKIKTTATKSAAAKPTASSARKPAAKSTPASKTSAKSKDTSPKTKRTSKKHADPASQSPAQRRTSGVIKQESDFLNPSSTATPFDHSMSQFYNYDQTLSYITGIYDIQCTIQEDFPAYCENGCRMMLCREQGTGRVWGSFSWGPFFGVIQLNPGPSRFSEDSLSLGWRAKHLDTGSLEFGRGKTGNMIFRNVDEISGQLFDLFGNFVEFFGRRRNGPANCGFSPAQFAAEWAQYPAIAYGRNQPDNRQSFESGPNHAEYESGANGREPYDSELDQEEDPYGIGGYRDSDGGESNDELDHEGSYDSELDHGDSHDGEPDDEQLYDEDGQLSPTGRYEQLMRQSLGGW